MALSDLLQIWPDWINSGVITKIITEDMTLALSNTKLLVLLGSVMLTACSSKPSPWAETSSPWGSAPQAEAAETMETAEAPEAMDEGIVEAEPMDTGMISEEPMEPMEPMSAEAMTMESGMYQSEPEPEPVPMEPAEPVLPESGMVMPGNLMAQPANAFVVQVVASSTMKQLTDFASKHQLSDEWVAETTVNGKVWHVLLLGVYPDRAEAERALQSVTDLDTQPWIRTVGSLQAVMN
jgi:septal ring-binding cell division protein DamX